LIIPIRARHDFAAYNWKFKIPTSRKYTREHGAVYITVPPNLREYRIKEIRILPKQRGRFLEAAFIYESNQQSADVSREQAISIDLGLNNLATVVSSTNESFIIDGRWLKSVNQWFNKRRARLISHKEKQGIEAFHAQSEAWLSYRRKNQVNDYLNKAARYTVNFCLKSKDWNDCCGLQPNP
jgi:putative transposase